MERITVLGTCDLLLHEKVSMKHILAGELVTSETFALLYGMQLNALEGRIGQDDIWYAIKSIVQDKVELYGPDRPLRRAR